MKKSCLPLFCALAAALSAAGSVRAAATLPKIFSDNMVLQRDKPIPVWGHAAKGETVKVSFNGQEKTATAGDDGKWMVKLDPIPANKNPQEFTVAAGNTIIFKNVVVGEVWICAGQSNMELTVAASLNFEKEKAAATNGLIRSIKFPHVMDPFPQDDVAGAWTPCSPDAVGAFTAAGYFFALEIYRALDVPVGLIGTNWGGTRIEPWTPPEGFRQVPELKDLRKQVDESLPTTDAGQARYQEYFKKLKEWMPAAEEAVNARQIPPSVPVAPWIGGDQQQPTKLYNAMIAPLIPLAMRGVLWYQGEANSGDREYSYKMRALIGGWRHNWGAGDFPFYYVQLANLGKFDANNPAGGDGYSSVRDEQQKALTISNTGMAVIIDIGDPGNVHPKDKQDVGKRLALWALAKDYGKGGVFSGPLYKSHAVEGDKIRVSFNYAENGLIVGEKTGLDPVKPVSDGKLKCFVIAGEDKKFYWANAAIDKQTVIVSSESVPHPVAVRYAYFANPEGANLYNSDGLPAGPFRTDDW